MAKIEIVLRPRDGKRNTITTGFVIKVDNGIFYTYEGDKIPVGDIIGIRSIEETKPTED